MTISATLTWTGGTMSGAGMTSIPVGAALNVDSSPQVILSQRTFSNAGTATWTSANTNGINLNTGAVFNNSGSFDCQANNSTFNVGTGTLNNSGTFKRSAGAGTVTISVGTGAFNNTGTLAVQTGILTLSGASTHTGATVSVAAGSTLTFPGSTHTLDAACTFSGAGAVFFNGATVTINCPYAVSGLTTLSGGSHPVSPQPIRRSARSTNPAER